MDKLINAVLAQIKKDIAEGDMTSIEELLRHTPEVTLIAYLPEDQWAEHATPEPLSADDEAFIEAYPKCFSAGSYDIECLLDFVHGRENPDIDGIIVDAYHLWNMALTHSTKE